MKRRRGEVFLASKTHDRTRDGSLRLLERSLKLLQTDHLDLWQLHNLSTKQEVDQIFGPGGAIEALTQARDQKMVRCLGLTGHHDPEVLLAALGRFPFDAILLSLNAADRHHLPFTEKLLPAAVEKDMAIIGMKVPSRGRLLGHAGISMREAMRYVLTLPVSTVIIGVDSIAQLQENVEIAQSFTPITQVQMAALEQRVQPLHKDALFYRRWDA
jgi:predicted aldo/keto reductase-like oxidoreductase